MTINEQQPSTATTGATFDARPPPAGHWLIGGSFRVYLERPPAWLHRMVTRALLGWTWHDRPE